MALAGDAPPGLPSSATPSTSELSFSVSAQISSAFRPTSTVPARPSASVAARRGRPGAGLDEHQRVEQAVASVHFQREVCCGFWTAPRATAVAGTPGGVSTARIAATAENWERKCRRTTDSIRRYCMIGVVSGRPVFVATLPRETDLLVPA